MTEQTPIRDFIDAVEQLRQQRKGTRHLQRGERKRFTQKELAEQAYPSYENLLAGRTHQLPSRSIILNIARYLNCTDPERDHLLQLIGYAPENPAIAEHVRQVTVIAVRFAFASGELSGTDEDIERAAGAERALHQHIKRIVQEWGGRYETLMGGTGAALWGMGMAQEDDPERAVIAALAMQAAVRVLNAQQAHQTTLTIGIHTGLVWLEPDGDRILPLGTTLHIAGELERVASPDEVHISAATCAHIRGAFDVQVVSQKAAARRAVPLVSYRVLQARIRTFKTAFTNMGDANVRMVGREKALERLQQSFTNAINHGQLEAVIVKGEAGIGKTRLLHEFRDWLSIIPDPLVLISTHTDRTSPYRAYSLFIDFLERHFDLSPLEGVRAAQSKIRHALMKVFKPFDAEKRAAVLARLMGDERQGKEGMPDNTRVFRDQVLAILTDYLAALAPHQILVWIIEDIHHADQTSLEMLGELCAKLLHKPVCVLCSARTDPGTPEPTLSPAFKILKLDPLPPAAARQMIEQALKAIQRDGRAIVDFILSQTDGNPFFIEEMVNALVQQQILVQDTAEGWTINAEQLERVQMPTTIRGVLQSQFDYFGLDERQVLRCAAIIGRTFWDDAVAFLQETDSRAEASVQRDVLGRLQSRSIVIQHRTSVFRGYTAYSFRHALQRDMIYELIGKQDRKQLHLRAARWYERIIQNHSAFERYLAVLAEHLEEASEAHQAAYYYEMAGQRAAARFANPEAVYLFSRALSLLPANGTAQRYAVLKAREGVYDLMAKRDLQQQDLEALAQISRAVDDPALHIEVLLRQANFGFVMAQWADALAHLQRALPLAETLARTDLLAQLHRQWIQVLYVQGDHAQVLTRIDTAFELARRAKRTDIEAELYLSLGIALLVGRTAFDDARTALENALHLFQRQDNLRSQAKAYGNLALVEHAQERFAQSRALHQKAYALYTQVGDRRGERIVLITLGNLETTLANAAAAQAYYEKALQDFTDMPDLNAESVIAAGLAHVALLRGDFAQAMRRCQQALTINASVTNRGNEAFVRSTLIHAHLRCGLYDDARTLLMDALATEQSPYIRGDLLLLYTNLLLCEARYDEALETVQDAADIVQQIGLSSLDLACHLLSAEVFLHLKQYPDAAQHYQMAEGRCQASHNAIYLPSVWKGQLQIALDKTQYPDIERLANAIYEHQLQRPLEGIDDPMSVYLTCWRALHMLDDARAPGLLMRAYQVMMTSAEHMEDDRMRRAYLENIASNAHLRQLLEGRTE